MAYGDSDYLYSTGEIVSVAGEYVVIDTQCNPTEKTSKFCVGEKFPPAGPTGYTWRRKSSQ